MNAADLARLELAKRAFRATEPNATEVQRGVRRARLALQRPRARRRWFSKGAVMLVLAVGGLAYAKPQALNDFVASALTSHDASTKHGTARATGAAALIAPHEPAPGVNDTNERQLEPVIVPSPEPTPVAEPTKVVAEPTRAVASAKAASTPHVAPTPSAARAAAGAPPAAGTADAKVRAGASTEAPTTANAVSDWGRVAQALAQGDESKALSALSTLSESGDSRTRDKADIGRAQLFMANGDHEGACALARDLTRRNAGGRIDRQAQAILKSCPR
jgi:hypothetical protein